MVEEAEKKTDNSTEVEVTDDVRSGLQERLKFFFSDANLRQDHFMRQPLLRQQGVPVEALMRFNTITKHTKDVSVFLKVASEMKDLLVVSADSKAISRKTPFTWDNMKDNIPLTLYVSNIPVSNEKYDVTTEEFKKLFEDQQGLVLVKLCFKQIYPDGAKKPRAKPLKRVAHGSALVEFDTVEHLNEAAAKFLTIKDGKEVEPAQTLELKGQTLQVITLAEHDKKDKEDQKDQKEKEVQEKKRKTAEKTKVEKEESNAEEKLFTIDWKPKCVIKLIGLAESCTREALDEAVAKALDVSVEAVKEKKKWYTDYSRGQSDGAVRFSEPCDEVEVVQTKLASGDVLVAEEKVKEAIILEGDSEKEYWNKFIEFKNNQLKQHGQERRNKRRKRH